MRACFLGQNEKARGYGLAILHSPRLPDPEPPLGEKRVPPEGRDEHLPDESPIRPPEPA